MFPLEPMISKIDKSRNHTNKRILGINQENHTSQDHQQEGKLKNNIDKYEKSGKRRSNSKCKLKRLNKAILGARECNLKDLSPPENKEAVISSNIAKRRGGEEGGNLDTLEAMVI